MTLQIAAIGQLNSHACPRLGAVSHAFLSCSLIPGETVPLCGRRWYYKRCVISDFEVVMCVDVSEIRLRPLQLVGVQCAARGGMNACHHTV